MLIIGLVALVKASDVFVDAASSFATRMRVPKMLVALTIAAFGTCAPELAISFTSIATKNVDMTLANVIGSCIVNILLIVGVATIVKPIEVKEQTVKRELPLLVLVSAAFFFVLNDSIFFGRNNGLGRWDAVVLLALFGLFMLYIFFAVHVKKVRRGRLPKTKYTTGYSLVYIVLSLITIALAANIAVDNAVAVAGEIGISQKIIAMTVIVIGTSLPELTMTVGAAKKGEFDLAVGNIIGTNIFNICIVLGLPTLIFGGFESGAFGIVDTLVVLLAAVAYYIFGRSNKRLTRKEGIFMVMLFAAYYVYVLLT
ncbi:calcium/sodium antiporter [Candidatus Saccharibacteria bacterium]|nr:calcium/sodium antiporter [Candidatus Saccharibacteria bacterium]